MVCPSCRCENPDHARYCASCSAPLREPIDPVERARFCVHCGQPLPLAASSVRAAPGTYTPKHLADKILTSRSALEGERKQVTVLFADVENFTRLGERLDPEDLHGLMDRVFAVLLDAVHRYEGTVNQFTGDGVMALFGAPVAVEDHALRAVEAALEIQSTMAARADEFRAAFGSAPQLRIGLNTGRVVVGKIGDDLRMDYTAQGDTVNLAARLQMLAEAGTVAMSATTQRLVGTSVEGMSLGAHRVKGKEQPVEVFRPLRLRRRATVRDASADRIVPFVGREMELARLIEFLAEARSGRPRSVVVIGDAGVGKSRLLREARRRTEREARWVAGHGVPYGRATPYRPMVEIIRAIFDVTDDDGEHVARGKVETQLAALGDDAVLLGPALRWLLALGTPDPALAVLSPTDRKATITRALDGLLRRLATSTPHVVVVEACQWLDPATDEYLASATRRLDTASLAFVFTRRPDETGRASSPLGSERIVLRPVAPPEARALVSSLAPDLSRDLVELVADRTGGNPLFLEEVTRSVLETGTARIPPTVEDVLMARIDRLPPRAKAVLQTTAVIGRQFSRPLLVRVVGDDGTVDAAIDTLVGVGLIQRTPSSPDVFTCEQPLVHEVTYEGLLHQHRKLLHRKVGEGIEDVFAQRLGEHVEELARHFTQADDWARALHYDREAGAKAAALGANTHAARWFERALDVLGHLPVTAEVTRQTIEIQLELCRSLVQLGRLDEVLKLARQAEALAQRLGDDQRLGEVYAYIANYHYMKGEPDAAIRYGCLCLEIGDRSETSRTRRAARQYLATSYHALGEYAMAEEILGQQIAALESTESFERVGPVNLAYVSACAWLAFTLADVGEFDTAHQVAERGLQAAMRAGHPYARAIATTFAGYPRHMQGDTGQALPMFETSFQLCAEHHLEVWRPVASALLGHASVVVGKVDHGLELLWDAAAVNERLGVVAYRALWTTYLADALLLNGQAGQAVDLAQRALDLAVQHKEQGNATRALQVLGTALIQLGPGALERAEQHLQQALEQAERLRMRPLVATCYASLAALARKRGDAPGAARFAGTARSLANELAMRFWWERTSVG
jgi:class 3 adenylate cyclase/tetratricopeptide (TPR) repeat protein